MGQLKSHVVNDTKKRKKVKERRGFSEENFLVAHLRMAWLDLKACKQGTILLTTAYSMQNTHQL